MKITDKDVVNAKALRTKPSGVPKDEDRLGGERENKRSHCLVSTAVIVTFTLLYH